MFLVPNHFTIAGSRWSKKALCLLSSVAIACMSSALTGCFLAAKPGEPLEAAAEALAAFGVAAEHAADGAGGPGTFHARLYDALYALEPESLDGRAHIEEL